MKKYIVRDGNFFEDDVLEMEAKNHYEVITHLKTNYPWMNNKEVLIENVNDIDEHYFIVL